MTYPELARQAIKQYLLERTVLSAPRDFGGNKEGGVFVSLHTKNGELRGCIGTFLPVRDTLAEEIIYNAIAAATEDPRFNPVHPGELDALNIEVSLLSLPEACVQSELDPKKYGVIVSAPGGRRGLLLPDLEGIDSIQQQIDIAAQKGGIDADRDKISLQRFTTTVYRE